MLSILFDILTRDDMQDDGSNMLQFLVKYKKMVQIGQKTPVCSLILRGFELRLKILPNGRVY